jgi:bacteriocin biosynthesis cyclodehydratase domain-containing protein
VSATAPPGDLARVRDDPHLVVAIRETAAVIGPFVVPGETPCVRCVELARSDRDPGWPALAAQLAAHTRATDACDIALATLAASVAALHALTWLDSDGTTRPPSAAGIVEYDVDEARLRRRTIRPHPACGCGAAAGA